MEGELESLEEPHGVFEELDAGGISEDEECALSEESRGVLEELDAGWTSEELSATGVTEELLTSS